MKQPDFSLIPAIYLALLVFGYLYNLLVGWLERKKYLEGYVWLAVATGVFVTISALAIIDWRFALIALGAFAFSGAPMAAGSIWRYVRPREETQEEIRNADE